MNGGQRTFFEALDHLLIGTPTLEAGIAWLQARTGVHAAPGGTHPGLGTWNALASLGPSQYIEIIAPDPAQPGVETAYVPGLRDLKEPRVVTWAASMPNLAAGFEATISPDLLCEPVRQGSRIRTDGVRLSWSLAFPRHRRHGAFAGTLPFLIRWDSAASHPGMSTPAGLTLRAMTIRHPENAVLGATLASLGMGSEIERGPASIQVELTTPRGIIVL